MHNLERLIVPLFIITAALGLVYWYWTTTPSYAVSQVVTAIRNHDVETFQKYVDLDTLGERAFQDILRGPAIHSGMFGNFDSMIGIGIASLFKREIVEIFKSEVTRLVAWGSLDLDPGEKSPPARAALVSRTSQPPQSDTLAGRNFLRAIKPSRAEKLKLQLADYGLNRFGYRGVEYFKQEGGVTLIGLKFHSPRFNFDYIIEFKLEDAGGYWRVTELSNLSELVAKYMETRNLYELQTEPSVREPQETSL